VPSTAWRTRFEFYGNTTSYVNVTGSVVGTGSSAVSVCGYVLIRDSNGGILSLAVPGEPRRLGLRLTNNLRFRIDDTLVLSGSFPSSEDFQRKWHYACATVEASTLDVRLYFDAVEIKYAAGVGSLDWSGPDANVASYLAQEQNNYQELTNEVHALQGSLALVNVWNKTLTADDIA
jgi:hypothetical protein